MRSAIYTLGHRLGRGLPMVVRGAQKLGRRVEFEDAATTFHVACKACRPLLSQATLGELEWDLLTGKSGP